MRSGLLSAGPVPDGLAARVAAGPAFWADWVDDLDRGGLLEELLGRDAIGRALAEAPGSGRYDSALNAKMTLVCVLVGCLFPGEGYDQVLARAFGIPGLRFWPGPVPTASALSQARERLGEHALRRLFEIDAETGDAALGLTALWHGLEVTAIDGTTMELDRNDALACEFGSSSEAGRPGCCGSSGTSAWPAAAGSPRKSAPITKARTSWLTGSLALSGAGWSASPTGGSRRWNGISRRPEPALTWFWRWKNDSKSLPARTLEVLPDGSELVVMRESGGMLARRRRSPAAMPPRGCRTRSPAWSPSPS